MHNWELGDLFEREEIVAHARPVIRVVALLLGLLRIMCFPAGLGVSPKRDLNAFNNLADVGNFVSIGVTFVGAAAVLFVASFLFPSEAPGGEPWMSRSKRTPNYSLNWTAARAPRFELATSAAASYFRSYASSAEIAECQRK
jgi:hypothetical protein